MGTSFTDTTELDHYRNLIHKIGVCMVNRIVCPWFKINFLYKLFGDKKLEDKLTAEVHKITGNIISRRRKAFKDSMVDQNVADDYEGRKHKYAMLDTLLLAESSSQIDTQGIQEEVDTFIFEGFDTTMTALTFILFCIAQNDEVQHKLYTEVLEIIGTLREYQMQIDMYTQFQKPMIYFQLFLKLGQESETADFHTYADLKYMDCVIKEALRLYPPVPFIGRTLGEESVLGTTQI